MKQREFAVSFRSSDFTCSECNKPNHTLAILGQFCCPEIVWMEKISRYKIFERYDDNFFGRYDLRG